MKNSNNKIDFVVLWVDPNDPEWQKQRQMYFRDSNVSSNSIDNGDDRYRDWGLFKYWFRGVEKYAPWVNKVHLVTCGHVPEWLNLSHPKLNIVKHSDIMPREALPTFNSNAIELCIHKIPGLSEQFVLFNDDMFIIKPVKPNHFFKKGKPVNTLSLLALTPSSERKYCRTLENNLEMINDNFDYNSMKKKEIAKLLSPKQGKYLLTTVPLLLYKDCPGFKNYHICISYLKSTFYNVWKKEENRLSKTVFSRFRDYDNNVNHWIMNYWQFMTGNFAQGSAGFGVNLDMSKPAACEAIRKKNVSVICLSEPAETLKKIDGEILRKKIQNSFEHSLNKQSGYEL